MRKLLIGLLAVSLVLAGVLVALVMPRHCPVNRAAYDRIEEGMSLAEVEALLGGPPGDYRTVWTREEDKLFGPTRLSGVALVYGWAGDEGNVYVMPDRNGIVCWKDFVKTSRGNLGVIETLRWRFDRWRGVLSEVDNEEVRRVLELERIPDP
jgi:hypothetical protein